MTELAEPDAESSADGGYSDPDESRSDAHRAHSGEDPERVAARVGDRAERVRRRELETALGRLEARGEVSPAERRVVARLSERIADALVERWASGLSDGEVDPETALELLAGRE